MHWMDHIEGFLKPFILCHASVLTSPMWEAIELRLVKNSRSNDYGGPSCTDSIYQHGVWHHFEQMHSKYIFITCVIVYLLIRSGWAPSHKTFDLYDFRIV